MKTLIFATVLCAFSSGAIAQDMSCKAQADEKKLAGAAMTSFVKKCAQKACDTSAMEKKLAGAAKASFTKKCVTDAISG